MILNWCALMSVNSVVPKQAGGQQKVHGYTLSCKPVVIPR